MDQSRLQRTAIKAGVSSVLLLGALLTPIAASAEPSEGPASSTAPIVTGSSISEADRSLVLGTQTQHDAAVSVVGDATGVTVMQANESDGYAWRPVATLRQPSVESDRWISNWCVAGPKVVVVYGTRTMVNQETFMDEGAWAATVDLKTGAVTDLGRGYTMAYFNPSCGPGDRAALTAYGQGVTRVGLLDTAHGVALWHRTLVGEVTAPTPDANSGVVAVTDNRLIGLTATTETTIGPLRGSTYSLSVDRNNLLSYVSADGSRARIFQQTASTGSKASAVAEGPASSTDLSRAGNGRLYFTGPSLKILSPGSGQGLDVPPRTKLSSSGALAVTTAYAPTPAEHSGLISVAVAAKVVATGRDVSFRFSSAYAPNSVIRASKSVQSVAHLLRASPSPRVRSAAAAGSPTSPVEAERTCSIPRNDTANQAYQPKPRQVEWAVNMAVGGNLTTTSANDLSNLGSSSFSPQGMFPLHSLVGGGHIPSQVLLGILAQESNLWQADRYTSPGSLGNPLIGNFYGQGSSASAFWTINFGNADCGYGVAQITDGMQQAGIMRAGDSAALPAAQQRAIAIDYSTNIARAAETLADKWNQVVNSGMVLNNGGADSLENWFFAVWAYNTGFHAQSGSSPWGVGWANNPVNPIYPANRHDFLDGSPADAASPQNWPYPEKVMGFAAWSESLPESVVVNNTTAHPTGYSETDVAGFNLAWWDTAADRVKVKPPTTLFCSLTVNACDNTTTAKCTRSDDECWWHTSATWQSCPDQCGHENVRFDYPTYSAAQADGVSLPGRCDSGGLPSGAIVVDDTSSSTAPARSGCTKQASQGSFAFTFYAPDSNGSYPAKIDLHQQGGGFNDHFYFTHTRNVTAGNSEEISGTWSLGKSIASWTRVFVHVPSYAAWSPRASYLVSFGNGKSETRTLNQHRFANEWVPLGVFQMAGTPTVTLTNLSTVHDGFDDIAWDAVAFQTLSAKPADFVVAIGDSFSSGEGATTDLTTGASYTSESDHDGTDADPLNSQRNGCHRSSQSWSRKTTLADSSSTIGSRADSFDASMDYHLLACSGAVTSNLQSGQLGQYGELNQIDQGYLDSNTTLVTLSIGGNDMRFAAVVQQCLFSSTTPCDQTYLAADNGVQLGTAQANLLKNTLPGLLDKTLQGVHAAAPNAKIVLMGYPELFETGSTCIGVKDVDRTWLNSQSTGLRDAMAAAAQREAQAGAKIRFEDPEPFFTGHNLCANGSAENGIVTSQTPGDQPAFSIPQPGTNTPVGVSQQSLHPNLIGTTDYANALQDALTKF